jgi:hypothetical protein
MIVFIATPVIGTIAQLYSQQSPEPSLRPRASAHMELQAKFAEGRPRFIRL